MHSLPNWNFTSCPNQPTELIMIDRKHNDYWKYYKKKEEIREVRSIELTLLLFSFVLSDKTMLSLSLSPSLFIFISFFFSTTESHISVCNITCSRASLMFNSFFPLIFDSFHHFFFSIQVTLRKHGEKSNTGLPHMVNFRKIEHRTLVVKSKPRHRVVNLRYFFFICQTGDLH